MAQTKNQTFRQTSEPIQNTQLQSKAQIHSKAGLEERQNDQESAELLSLFPYGPGFFGKNLTYMEKKGGLFSRSIKVDLGELRREVNNFTNKQGLSQCRETIKTALAQQPGNSEIHVLNAILVYNDAMQAGATELNKLNILKNALVEIGKAMHGGTVSLFNTNWLIAIYSSYLGFLSDRLRRFNTSENLGVHSKGRKVRDELGVQLAMARNLRMISERQKGLKRLNGMLKKTGLFVKNLDLKLVNKAARAYLKGGANAPLGSGENLKCGLVLQLHFTLTNLFAHAPIFDKLVQQMLKMVPEVHRDFILQKRMVLGTQKQLEFYQAFAQDKSAIAKDLASQLFAFHSTTISEHLGQALLNRPFMIDPFVKFAWLIKDSSFLYRVDQNAARAQKAIPMLRIVQGERCEVNGAHQVASSLIYDMQRILTQAGL